MNKRFVGLLAILFALAVLLPGSALAQPIPFPASRLASAPPETPTEVAQSLQILFLLTVLALAPAILVLMTSFTRVIIVLSFVRNALATQQMPPIRC